MARKQKGEVKRGTPAAHGTVTVMVAEEQQRFAVPLEYLSHPLFAELLEEAAAEYGFSHSGAIAIPCAVDHFRRVLHNIERDLRRRRRRRHPNFTLPITK
ncbi:auxin-responsive protein SAUR32-like [Zingiber officinale]|uniref:Uncharacterized protein n=1 Tax=Zingiber officinale TaxID=94328 RepID=A0A8J5GW25_ZINOF|nr:auxin-responsive protein SAUR32-like [Zingiber officinale]KAG6507403.1 hypothetical protein ZIOFF_032746 [Zingiber officinale]